MSTASILPRPLRPMTVADIDAVLAVEDSTYSYPWTRGNFIDSLAAEHWAQMLNDEMGRPQAYYVAMPAVDELHLLNLTVAPTSQGRGLARALLGDLMARAARAEMQRLLLEVRPSNQRALRVYRAGGFAEVGVRKGYYPSHEGQREDAIVMALALTMTGALHGLD